MGGHNRETRTVKYCKQSYSIIIITIYVCMLLCNFTLIKTIYRIKATIKKYIYTKYTLQYCIQRYSVLQSQVTAQSSLFSPLRSEHFKVLVPYRTWARNDICDCEETFKSAYKGFCIRFCSWNLMWSFFKLSGIIDWKVVRVQPINGPFSTNATEETRGTGSHLRSAAWGTTGDASRKDCASAAGEKQRHGHERENFTRQTEVNLVSSWKQNSGCPGVKTH